MQKIIHNLRKAKQAHKRWVGHAAALIEGINIDKEQVPINHTDCIFGQWYYGEGQNLSSLQEFKNIENSHSDLHLIYMEIFKLLFQEKKLSFFSRLIGRSSKANADDIKMAKVKYRLLVEVSNEIVIHLDNLEKKLKKLGEDGIKKLIS